MRTYLYKGYKIKNIGYHQPDHCVWWEAVDEDGFACFHGKTLREVEMLINDSEWEDKLKAKEAEIEKLKAALKTCVDYVKCEYGCGSECDAACEEIESGCKLREWTIEFGLETIDRKGTENGKR